MIWPDVMCTPMNHRPIAPAHSIADIAWAKAHQLMPSEQKAAMLLEPNSAHRTSNVYKYTFYIHTSTNMLVYALHMFPAKRRTCPAQSATHVVRKAPHMFCEKRRRCSTQNATHVLRKAPHMFRAKRHMTMNQQLFFIAPDNETSNRYKKKMPHQKIR